MLRSDLLSESPVFFDILLSTASHSEAGHALNRFPYFERYDQLAALGKWRALKFDFEPGMHSNGVGGLSLSCMGTQIIGIEKLCTVKN